MRSNRAPYTRIPHLLHVKDNSIMMFLPRNPSAALETFPRQYDRWLPPSVRADLRDENHLPFQAWSFTLLEKPVFSWEILENKKSLQGLKIPKDGREGLVQWISNAKNIETAFGQVTLMLYCIRGSQRVYVVSQGTPGNLWRHFWLSWWGTGGRGVPLASTR